MSEQQMVYAVSEHDFPARIAWHRAARDLERMVMVEAEKPDAAAELQRAADLLTLIQLYHGQQLRIWYDRLGILHVAIDESAINGPVRLFQGENAITEAAAFVRGGGG